MALPTRVHRGQQYDPFENAHREFDTMLNRFFSGGSEVGNGSRGYLAPYAVDVREDGDHLYVEAELPGFKKDEIDITLENQTLTISAERRRHGVTAQLPALLRSFAPLPAFATPLVGFAAAASPQQRKPTW